VKRSTRVLSCGFALGAMIWSVGCANGAVGTNEQGPLPGDGGGTDATIGTDDGSPNPGEDAPSTGDDATSGTDTGPAQGDDGGQSEDSPSTSDDGSATDAEGTDASETGDAGHDSGTTTEDAGHDSGTTTDAGHDSGTTADAGHDSGTTVDAGTDSGTTIVDSGTDSAPITVATGGACDTGQTCATGDECAGGQEPDGGGFLCFQQCTTNSNCTEPPVNSGGTSEPKNGPYCVDVVGTGTTPNICSVPCNPVTNAGATGCPDGLACAYEGSTTIPEYTDCVAAGGVASGGTCKDTTLANSCGAGLVCVVTGTSTSGTCRVVCRAGNNADCPSGTCGTFSGITSPMFGFCN
jgi:hypothetical protein